MTQQGHTLLVSTRFLTLLQTLEGDHDLALFLHLSYQGKHHKLLMRHSLQGNETSSVLSHL